MKRPIVVPLLLCAVMAVSLAVPCAAGKSFTAQTTVQKLVSSKSTYKNTNNAARTVFANENSKSQSTDVAADTTATIAAKTAAKTAATEAIACTTTYKNAGGAARSSASARNSASMRTVYLNENSAFCEKMRNKFQSAEAAETTAIAATARTAAAKTAADTAATAKAAAKTKPSIDIAANARKQLDKKPVASNTAGEATLKYFPVTLFNYSTALEPIAGHTDTNTVMHFAEQDRLKNEPDDAPFDGIYFSGGTDVAAELSGSLPYLMAQRDYKTWNYWTGAMQNGYHAGYFYGGMVQKRLGDDLLPVFNSEAAESVKLFSTSEAAYKDVYENVGLPFVFDESAQSYTFDSARHNVYFANENYASDTNLSWSDSTLAFSEDPNSGESFAGFFPFNDITMSKYKTKTAKSFRWLGESHAREKTLHNFIGEVGAAGSEAKFHFGMSASIPFTMTENGYQDGTLESDPIMFEFSGDDDCWVYIDDTLVADIGGIHDAVNYTLDFAGNAITVTTAADKGLTSERVSGDVSGTVTRKTGECVTLGAIFDDAGKNIFGAINLTRESFAKSAHVLRIFYLERGRGVSNSLISFNLPQCTVHGSEVSVIDYGLPVIYDVLRDSSQADGSAPLLYCLGEYSDGVLTASAHENGTAQLVKRVGDEYVEVSEAELEGYRALALENGGDIPYLYIKYTPTRFLDSVDTVTYTLIGGGKYFTDTLTIIPATSMYYEQDFKNAAGENFITYNMNKTGEGACYWESAGESRTFCTYQEPGIAGEMGYSPYGADKAYINCTGDGIGGSYYAKSASGCATPAFRYTFTGTGSAIFTRTSMASGYIYVDVTDVNSGECVYTAYIDTLYANKNGLSLETLYNIPVVNVQNLAYGTYCVTVQLTRPSPIAGGRCELHLDGVRVYDPLGIENLPELAEYAYAQDGESGEVTMELREHLLSENSTGENSFIVNGVVTDTDGCAMSEAEFSSMGPKHELYLSAGQRISFTLADWFTGARKRLFVGMKSPSGEDIIISVNGSAYTVRSCADFYYEITDKVAMDGTRGIVEIEVVSGRLAAFTNIKLTSKG